MKKATASNQVQSSLANFLRQVGKSAILSPLRSPQDRRALPSEPHRALQEPPFRRERQERSNPQWLLVLSPGQA